MKRDSARVDGQLSAKSRCRLFRSDSAGQRRIAVTAQLSAWVKEVFDIHDDFNEACRQVVDRLNHVESTTSSGVAISSEAFHAKLILTDANFEAAHFTLSCALKVGQPG